ncbi:MAG: hypothetical protein KDA80_19040 [Planctomycetaceae bacterium]|nr:hypothetical protein [Planctomycetaceae bacterium]
MAKKQRDQSKVCGAKNRQGKPCQSYAMPNGRCRKHGGKSRPPGPNHPTYKHGKRSKARLPDNLAEQVRKEMAVQNFLNLDESTAIIRVRRNELLKKLDGAADLPSLKQIDKNISAARKHLKDGNEAEAREVLRELEAQVERLVSHQTTWAEIQKTIEQERKLITSERDAMFKAGTLISTTQAVHAMNLLVGAAVEHLTDPKAVEAIQRQFALMIGKQKLGITDVTENESDES